jgi:hypothetical protein
MHTSLHHLLPLPRSLLSAFCLSLIVLSSPCSYTATYPTTGITHLDSWQLSQLRTINVGGNASCAEFFRKNGGSARLFEEVL